MHSETVTRRSLIDNIFSLYLLQGLNYLIPMAVLPYLVRVLGMDQYGLIAFASSFSQYFTLFTDYGFNYSATRFIAKNRDNPLATSRMYCCVLLIKGLLTVLGAAILVTILFISPRFGHDAAFFLVGYIAVLGNALFPVWYFQGIQQMRFISIISGAAKLVSAVLLFVFVHGTNDALLAMTIQSLGLVLAGLAGLWVSLRGVWLHLQWPSLAEFKTTLVEGWHLFISTAAISLYSNTNVFLVGLLAGNVQAAYFGIAEKLIRAMAGLVAPISQALFPHVSSLVEESSEAALKFIFRTLKRLGSLTILFSVFLFVFARPIATTCFGAAALGTVPIIRWISLLPFLITMNTALGVQTMVAFELDKEFSRILIVAGITNVILAIPLILAFGAQGAGASILFIESAIALTLVIVLRRNGINLASATRGRV